MPGEAGKQVEDAFKRGVSHRECRAHARRVVRVQLQLVVQKQAAVEVGDLAGQRPRCFAPVSFRFCKGFKKQGV